MPHKKVSVSIVSYNNKGFLTDCLPAVLGQDYPGVEVVLVDNASTDGTVEFVRENFPSVQIIENDRNYFFCKGHNIGIKNTTGEYVLVLNSDVVLADGFISEMVRAMESGDRVGAVSGKILRTGGELIDTTGLFLGRDRRPVERGYGEPDRGLYDKPGFIFGAGGVAPLYRRTMLDDLAVDGEYFDETFEAFYEDLDLAWRAARRGWKAYYTPLAVAWHKRGGTAKTKTPPLGLFKNNNLAYLSDEMTARVMRNRCLTVIKNDNLLDFLLNLPFILLYDIKIWAFISLFSPGAVPYFIKGLGALPIAWRRRKKLDET